MGQVVRRQLFFEKIKFRQNRKIETIIIFAKNGKFRQKA